VLLVNVHELHLVLSHAVLLGRLEDEAEKVGVIGGLDGDDIVVLGTLEDLGERSKLCDASVGCQGIIQDTTHVDTERDGVVAAVRLELLSEELERDKGDV
jgi:hypothetical protein